MAAKNYSDLTKPSTVNNEKGRFNLVAKATTQCHHGSIKFRNSPTCPRADALGLGESTLTFRVSKGFVLQPTAGEVPWLA